MNHPSEGVVAVETEEISSVDEVFSVVESLLGSTETNTQSHRVLTVLQCFFQQTLSESFAKLDQERKLRQACEDQLIGLSTKVNDLKREYSNTLTLREEEISNYEKENRKLSESNKRRADNLNKVRVEWSKLSMAPEMLQKRKDELINLERECFLKHVSYYEAGNSVTKNVVAANFGDNFSTNEVHVGDKVPLEQLRSEVAKTWVLINKQQRILEKLLDQFYAQIEQSTSENLLHDCNGNVIDCGLPQLPFVIPPAANPGTETKFQEESEKTKCGKVVERNTTICLLDTLISIGSLCKNGSAVKEATGQKKLRGQSGLSKVQLGSTEKHDSSVAAREMNSRLEERVKKYEDMVRNFDRSKVEALKDKLAAKIAKLEMQANAKLKP